MVYMFFLYYLQEQLLRQVQDTELYNRVIKWLESENFHCATVKDSGSEYSQSEIAVDLHTHGVEHSAVKLESSRLYYTKAYYSTDCVNKLDGNLISEPVVVLGTKQQTDTMFSSSHPSPSDSGLKHDHLVDAAALTMLLLVLPHHTWSGINEAKLCTEMNNLVSIENLPPSLKNEVRLFLS